MERVDVSGIVGSGVISESPESPDWERRIAERSDELYRARLVLRFLLAWAYPGNLVLIVLSALGFALSGASVVAALVVLVVSAASVIVSARLLYRQHLAVRALQAEVRALENAYRESQLEDLDPNDLLGLHKRYRAQLPEVIERYHAEARKLRWKGNALHTVVIGGSILAATLSAASLAIVDIRWGAVVVSLVVAVAAALAGNARYLERATALAQTADSLEREYESVALRVGRYRRLNDDDAAYAEFADAVEALRAGERIGDDPGVIGQ